MNIRDTLTYLSMIPMIFGILTTLAISALLCSTIVAGIVIGLGEWISS